MAHPLSRRFAVLACLLGLAGPCAWLATGARSEPLRMTARSSAGETPRGGAGLRAAAVPADQSFAVGGVAMQAAQGLARAYWGADACSGQVDVQWTDLDPTINAISSWRNPTSAYDTAAQNFDCSVRFNRLLAYDWARFCTVLAHEYGHLTGHQHSADANNVMTAIYNKPLAECVNAPDPNAPVPAPVAAPVEQTPSTAPVASTVRTAQATKARAARHQRAQDRKAKAKARAKAKHRKARRLARHRRAHRRHARS